MRQSITRCIPTVAFALLCAGLSVAFFAFNRFVPNGLTDEYDIVFPAIQYVSGNILPEVKYPSFPFYFHGIFFALFGTLKSPEASLLVARYVNFSVSLCNALLFFVFLRRLFSPSWALFSSVLWLTVPGVIVSGFLVKTESLQILETLLVLISLQKINEKPGRTRWHVLAGTGAALAISTKINPLPLMLYGLNFAFRRWHEKRNAAGITPFILTFLGVLLVSWTNLWVFPETITFWRADSYFLPGAGPFRAVDETFAFPYGRYSSFMLTTLPALIGVQSLYWIGALFLREPSRWARWVLGGGTAIALIIALNLTLSRFTHPFTPYLIFFVVAATAFIKRFAERGPFKPKAVNLMLAASLMALVLGQVIFVGAGIPKLIESLSKHQTTLEKISKQDLLFLMLPRRELELGDDHPRRTMQEVIHQRRPAYLYILNSYILNMCKYGHDRIYRENCTFFKRMVEGREDYRLTAKNDIALPGKRFFFDPEIREIAFYLFERRLSPQDAFSTPSSTTGFGGQSRKSEAPSKR